VCAFVVLGFVFHTSQEIGLGNVSEITYFVSILRHSFIVNVFSLLNECSAVRCNSHCTLCSGERTCFMHSTIQML